MLRRLLIVFSILITSGFPQNTTLVDFGASEEDNSFGLSGWNTPLISENLVYTSDSVNGLIVNESDPAEFSDYRGVQGTDHYFGKGDRIVVTWYNTSDQEIVFTGRVSFTDTDSPSLSDTSKPWYTMRNFEDYRRTFTTIEPNRIAKTVFNIEASGIHQTEGTYQSVNINLAIEWGSTYEKQYLICDKIELFQDADTLAPASPENLTLANSGDSYCDINWDRPEDDVSVVEYLIYVNSKVEGYSREESFTCNYLEPDHDYTIHVTALDATGNESLPSMALDFSTENFSGRDGLINPEAFEYLGAFAVPEVFAWGGEAIAYRCSGSPGESDGGSLFITNLNQPENGLVGEITLPDPVHTTNFSELPMAEVLTDPVNIRPENINNWDYVDIWRTGLAYHPVEERLYSSWSIHYTVSGEKHASISCCDANDLTASEKHGAYYVGDSEEWPIDAALNDWLFAVPESWANDYTDGRNMIVGRCRDGGLSGLGPTLFAFSDFADDLPEAEAELPITTLLEYSPVEGTDNYHYPNSLQGYKHSDDWREALWLNTDNQSAVTITGHKALGDNWYGYHGENLRHEWVIADVPYPDMYATDPDGKGWRAHRLKPMMIFYDPQELAMVAAGDINSFAPQPYAAFSIDTTLFFGTNHEIFSATGDTANKLIFVTEFVREHEGRLVIHVWQYDKLITASKSMNRLPDQFSISRIYPNPFNPFTTVEFTIPQQNIVIIELYDIAGRKVKEILNRRMSKGYYSIPLDGHDLASGIYFIQLIYKEQYRTRKLTLMK